MKLVSGVLLSLAVGAGAKQLCVGDNPLCGLSGGNRQICALREQYGCKWAGADDGITGPAAHTPMAQPSGLTTPTPPPTTTTTTTTTAVPVPTTTTTTTTTSTALTKPGSYPTNLNPTKAQPGMPDTPLSALGYTRLGDLVPSHSSVGWGSFQVNKHWYEHGFNIAGKHYTNGVYAHAPSDVRYHLERKYSFVEGCVGLNDQADGRVCGDGVDFHVIVDGERKWSNHQKGGAPVKCFKVDVRESETLQLVADHIIDRNCDEAEWIEVKLYEDPIVDCQQLGSLVPSYKSVGWGSYWVNENWYMRGFLINGVRYQHGVFAHADSRLIYPIRGRFHTFQACVGLDDGGGDCGDGVNFGVYGDGKRLYSKDKGGGEGATCFHLDISGVRSLQLVVDKKEDNDCDEAEWVNANLCTLKDAAVNDCEVSTWGTWDTCSRSCGHGYQTRKRTITRSPAPHGGKPCPLLEELQPCNAVACPVDCVVGSWSSWGQCTQTCGSGSHKRYRSIKQSNANGGKTCGDLMESKACGTIECPIDCVNGLWGSWSKCTKECGGGTYTRTRTPVRAAQHGGIACASPTDTVACNMQPCKVDCVTSSFGAFSTCSRSCGTGYKKRTRNLITAANHGGKKCPPMEHVLECNQHECPTDCVVSPHAPWEACSVTCGGGKQKRHLSVDVNVAFGGVTCPDLTQERACGTHACPTDCTHTAFAPWGPCSKSCGTGYSDRKRDVTVKETNGGKPCPHMYEQRQCNKHACPINCVVSEFGEYELCTKTCGGGTSSKRRTLISTAKFGGKVCPEESMVESKPCQTQPCPADCELSMWSSWGDCTKSCGSGTKKRERTETSGAAHGGKNCAHLEESVSCGLTNCPEDCTTTKWGPWTDCTRTCGTGTSIRTRGVVERETHGGQRCPPLKEHKYCNEQTCPLDCDISAWGNWHPCSKSCGHGFHTRYRHVNTQPRGDGKACPNLTSTKPCEDQIECPINCEVSAWGTFGDCTAGCGGGQKERTRSVTTQPGHNGVTCPALSQLKGCNDQHCPIHCHASDFSKWGSCSRTCGTGVMFRKRTLHTAAMFGGDDCPAMVDEIACNTSPCAIDCQVSMWGPYDACSKSCDMGFQTRMRSIVVAAAHGGRKCGDLQSVRFCNQHHCPSSCQVGEWGSWTECGKTCGGGVKARARAITVHPANGGEACPALKEEASCHSQACPVDCKLSYWGPFTECSATCGTGDKVRQRFKEQAASNGGLTCGHLTETASCDAGPCPVHCTVSEWGSWGDCSRTCGTGTHTRTRSIVTDAANEGRVCPILSQEDQCEVFPCPVNCRVGIFEDWSVCSQSCGGGTQSRIRPVLTGMHYGGTMCPAVRQQRNCNTHHCDLHAFWTKTATNAPTSAFDFDAKIAAATQHAKQANGVSNHASLTAAPTPVPTPALTQEALLSCKVGDAVKPSGWHGAGFGSNYCNLCKCENGNVSCQKKACAEQQVGKECSHLTCEMVYSYHAQHKIMLVNHHHAEHHGSDHRCLNNAHTGKCVCNCFGKANVIWTPFSVATTANK
jgi:hypothetical protein